MSVLSEVKKALDIQDPPSAVIQVGLLYYKLENGALYYSRRIIDPCSEWVPLNYTPEWVVKNMNTGSMYKKGKAAGWW